MEGHLGAIQVLVFLAKCKAFICKKEFSLHAIGTAYREYDLYDLIFVFTVLTGWTFFS